MTCSCGKNQTHPEVFTFLTNRGTAGDTRSLPGTGLFLVPDPEAGILEHKVVMVPGITLIECGKRGQNCMAFKWIPDEMMTAAQIAEYRARYCTTPYCSPTHECPPPCFCPDWVHNYCT